MCYDLAEYDPFKPLYIMAEGYNARYIDVELFDEPMTDEDWQEWLEADNNLAVKMLKQFGEKAW